MKNEDRPRFGVAMHWLAGKYPLGRDTKGDPVPRKLNAGDLRDYFDALSDLSISAIERGVKWHFGHSEFFPDRPASLRKSAEGAPAPRPAQLTDSGPHGTLLLAMSVEEQRKRLRVIFDVLNGKYGTSLKT